MVRRMDVLRSLARTNGLGRAVIGATLIAAPSAVAAPWVGKDELSDGAKLFARSLGARDLALGLGVVLAMKEDAPVRGWLEGAALADVVDAAATLIAWKKLPPQGRAGVLAIATVSAIQCALVARAIDG
jgi:hypothetical protein